MDDLLENLTEDEETDGPNTEQKNQERRLITMQTRNRECTSELYFEDCEQSGGKIEKT